MRKFSWIERIFALRTRKFRHPAKFGTPARRGAKGTGYGAAPRHSDAKSRSAVFGPLSAALPPSGKARISVADGAAKPRPTPDFRSYWLSQYSVWGCPPLRPPLHSPRSTPPWGFNYRGIARARVLCCGSFLLSLRSLRRSPSATRKCQRPLSLRLISVAAKHHGYCADSGNGIVPFSISSKFWPSPSIG